MISLLLLFVVAQDELVRTGGSGTALAVSQTVEAVCGDERLAITDYGARAPTDTPPSVRLNNRPLQGDEVSSLVGDISEPWSVYRFQFFCSQTGFRVRIGRGQGRPAPDVRYEEGHAIISEGRLASYEPMKAVSADFFWF